jgi:hypothetical protein
VLDKPANSEGPIAYADHRSAKVAPNVDRIVMIEKIDAEAIPQDELHAIESCFASLVDAALKSTRG